jgi:DNA-binding CsgD family transcriptional regulator
LTVRLSGSARDHQAALDGLERSHSATIVVDCGGTIVFATRLAEAILRQGEGLRNCGGRIGSADPFVAARLAALIRAAAGTATGLAAGAPRCGGLAIERGEDRLPLTVMVAPFRPKRLGFGTPLPAALIFIRDPEASGLGVDVLKDLFGLTPAQAAVAAHLAEGESLEHIAARLRISLHTARDHLKAVFAKTNTARQSQLVALLTRTVAALGSVDQSAPPIDRAAVRA